MELRVSNKKSDIEAILFDDFVFGKASKGAPIDKINIKIPIGEMIFIVGSFNGKDFGVCCFNRFKDGLKMHPYVLESSKRRYIEFVKKSIDMVKCNLYIEINDSEKLLLNLADKLGFDSIENNKANIILMRLKECRS